MNKTKRKYKSKRKYKTKRGGGWYDNLVTWNLGCPQNQTRLFGSKCGPIRFIWGCCRNKLTWEGGKKIKSKKNKKNKNLRI